MKISDEKRARLVELAKKWGREAAERAARLSAEDRARLEAWCRALMRGDPEAMAELWRQAAGP